jgi:hypothetical protein
MGKRNSTLKVAVFTLLIIPTPFAVAQSDNVKIFMSVLTADLEQLGGPKIDNGELHFGKTAVSDDAVDAVMKKQAGVATVLTKTGETYVRAATTIKKNDGTSAVGTTLDASSPAIAKLDEGEAYYGDATIFGKTYDAGYEPIKDATGAVIGAYFVGVPKK